MRVTCKQWWWTTLADRARRAVGGMALAAVSAAGLVGAGRWAVAKEDVAVPVAMPAHEASASGGDCVGCGAASNSVGCSNGACSELEPQFWPPGNRFDQYQGCPPPPLLHFSPRQTWYIVADAVGFKRDSGADRTFAALGTAANPVLGTDDLRFEFEGGLRTLIGRRFNDDWALEGSYFGLLTWDDERAIRDATPNAQGGVGNLMSPFSNFGAPAVPGLDFNNFASIRYASTLDNFELNFRQRVETRPSIMEVSMLYGFRYVDVREHFEYATQSTAPAPLGAAQAVDVQTGNDMYGFQLGTALEFRAHRQFWINLEMKGAVLHNHAVQNTSYSATTVGQTANFAGGVSRDRTSFLGDLALTFQYQFRPTLVGRIGYQAIWVDGVALAQDNFQSSAPILTLGPPQIDHAGNVVYHGPFAGLMYTW